MNQAKGDMQRNLSARNVPIHGLMPTISPRSQFALVTVGVLLLLLAVSLQAQTAALVTAPATSQTVAQNTTQPATPMALPSKAKSLKDKILAPHPNVAQSSIAAYVERARAESSAPTSPGSIWTENGRLAHLSNDVRAMHPHDLISVVVSESLAASTDGEVKSTRASTANSQISALFGLLHAGNAMQNLINQASSSGLNAQGASATNSSLSTTLGGQVIDVLPNGMLIIEAARQVEFSQQTQTIVLRGLVRPEDISQQNQVLSTAISSLELEVRGKGIVNDYTHRQNPLVRLIQKILVF
jgi:flagellar L-ring protein precursor FlgH